MVRPYKSPLLSSTKIQLPSMVGGIRIGPLVTIIGLPPPRTLPVEASSAHTAPPLVPGGAQQIDGLRAAPVRRTTDVPDVVALHVSPETVHIVPTKTTPPALAAGTERGSPGETLEPGA